MNPTANIITMNLNT